ncbi:MULTISPECIES: dienelactone hydrolase family protein [Mycobacteriaceae]|uniref:dienelactone hydrolase family protein n=1 Tax=Mycobacteriaceae TaxID=1762 RepID=UPI0007FFD0DE|nr:MULTISPECIES: dienelactone hydrolase family protein [Mycobacteriaceae]MCK0174332.1 dienelactone hydrolase family protein [Mycolicibacterium sp. F2034L]OBB60471.1 carboxymethylenebutenolidase [Mycobacterium sp. 852013-51886_SCH5428379]
MTTVRVDTPDGRIDALLGRPDGVTAQQGPRPGVVVVHDAAGISADNEAIVARVAAAGYVALAPNLYSRGGRARCITRVFRELLAQQGRVFDDLLATRDHLVALPECSGAVAIAGFCMGGQFALLLGAGNFGAAAPFYGVPLPKNLDDLLDVSCPIVASYGRRDPLGRGAPEKLASAVRAKGVPADIKVYPQAGHSFANRLPAQPLLRVTGFGYDDAATEDAWRRVFAFFDAHLPA